MSVQRQKFAQFAIDDPTYCAVRILALYAENCLVPMQRVQAITDAYAETVEESGDSTMAPLIPFKPQTEHECRKTASYELVRDVHIGRSNR